MLKTSVGCKHPSTTSVMVVPRQHKRAHSSSPSSSPTGSPVIAPSFFGADAPACGDFSPASRRENSSIDSNIQAFVESPPCTLRPALASSSPSASPASSMSPPFVSRHSNNNNNSNNSTSIATHGNFLSPTFEPSKGPVYPPPIASPRAATSNTALGLRACFATALGGLGGVTPVSGSRDEEEDPFSIRKSRSGNSAQGGTNNLGCVIGKACAEMSGVSGRMGTTLSPLDPDLLFLDPDDHSTSSAPPVASQSHQPLQSRTKSKSINDLNLPPAPSKFLSPSPSPSPPLPPDLRTNEKAADKHSTRLLLKADSEKIKRMASTIDNLERTLQTYREELIVVQLERDDALLKLKRAEEVINKLRSRLSDDEATLFRNNSQDVEPVFGPSGNVSVNIHNPTKAGTPKIHAKAFAESSKAVYTPAGSATLPGTPPPPPPPPFYDGSDLCSPDTKSDSSVVLSPTLLHIAHTISTPNPKPFFYASGGDRPASPTISRPSSPPLPFSPRFEEAPIQTPVPEKPLPHHIHKPHASPKLTPQPPASSLSTSATLSLFPAPTYIQKPTPLSPTLSPHSNGKVLSPCLSPSTGIMRSTSPALPSLYSSPPTSNTLRYSTTLAPLTHSRECFPPIRQKSQE